MSYNYLDKSGLSYFWGKIKSKIEGLTRNDLAILDSVEYSGLYGSANDRPGASFYFAYVRPTSFFDVWRIKYRIYANVPGQNNYKQFSEVEIFGSQNGMSFKSFNRLYSTSFRCYLYHNTYLLNSTGYNSNYKHAIGVGLRGSTNPTSSSYPRTIKIELLETENCTVELLDNPVKEANIPGYGSTNFAGASEINGGDNGLQETGDATVIHQLRHNNGTYLTTTNLYRYQICFTKNETTLIPANAVNNSTATNKTLTTEEFDPFGNIMYYSSTTAVNAGSAVAGSALYYQLNMDLRYSFNTGSNLTSNKAVFLKCVPQSNGMAKLDSTPIVQQLPTTADGKIYIYLGMASNGYQIELNYRHPIYEYKSGKIQAYTGQTSSGGGGASLEDVYPVGSIYMSINSTNPATLFGIGTWTQIKDVFLLSAGDTYTAGSTGGEATHTLTIAEMPSHTHPYGRNVDYNEPYEGWNGVGKTSITHETGATGGDQPHNNMPPYLAVYVWKRTA